jgi:opacity protein-like surface antigen
MNRIMVISIGIVGLLAGSVALADEQAGESISTPAPQTEPVAYADPVEPKKSHNRNGWYLGMNGIYVEDFFKDKLEDYAPNDLDLNVSSGGGLNVRGGYRVTSWFAAELMYQWVDGLKAKIDPDPDIPDFPDGELYKQTTHSIVANLKFIAPWWRIQPYIGLGIGTQYSKIKFLDDTPFGFSESNWSFLGRPAFGIDWIVCENWVINIETAGELAVNDFTDIAGSGTDLFTLSVGGGIQYRF